jgi:hypothetical protein
MDTWRQAYEPRPSRASSGELCIAAALLFALVTPLGCSDQTPGSESLSGAPDPAPFESRFSDGSELSETSSDALSSDMAAHISSPGAPSVTGHVSGVGSVASPHFRLRLSVGAPAMSTPVKSPSYQLLMLAPWTPDSSETP